MVACDDPNEIEIRHSQDNSLGGIFKTTFLGKKNSTHENESLISLVSFSKFKINKCS